ncbi:hypothetical protein vBCbaSRXM_5 [Citromicrobium phage vB_CbaS-RXM]|nr:hypothetical protein vBCbaSRXM_5 [Citromicrobium phage vB_CbaS-RXM]
MKFAPEGKLLETCKEATRRTYPSGYGHALIYCDNAANATIELHAAACAVVAHAYSPTGLKKKLHKDSDIARFTAAMAELPEGGTITQWVDRDGKPVTLARSITDNGDGTYGDGWRKIEYPATYGWLIEGCQLVLQAALGGYPAAITKKCGDALRAAGHPGY